MEALSKLVDGDACDGDAADLFNTLASILADRLGNA